MTKSKGRKYPISKPTDSWDELHCSSCNVLLAYADWSTDFDDCQIVCGDCYRSNNYD